MLAIRYTSKFKKDLKLAKKQGRDLEKLKQALATIAAGRQLPEHFRDHALQGDYFGHRECHIEPDWLLIYRLEADELVLTAVRAGSHSELFQR